MSVCVCARVLCMCEGVCVCSCLCMCVCRWDCSQGNPKFKHPYLLAQVVYKVATVGWPTTDYKKLSDFGKVTFDRASYATFPQSCVWVRVCV